jgi:hypothetical protein
VNVLIELILWERQGRKYDAEKRLVDLKQWKVLEKGGHFLALEVPDVLAK